MNASILSLFIVTAAMLVTPMYLVCAYHFSGASTRKGLSIGSISPLLGAVMTWVSLARIPDKPASLAVIGDLLIGSLAASVLLVFMGRHQLPTWTALLVFVLDVSDFISAFLFGYISSEGPAQLLYPDMKNNNLLYPTGLIPLFLVPYAIFFQTL